MVRQEIDGYLLAHCAISGLICQAATEADINPGRRRRTYPRVVKHARHNSHRIKKPADKGTRHDQPPTIALVNLRKIGMAA